MRAFEVLRSSARSCLNLSSVIWSRVPQNGSYVWNFISPKWPMQFFTLWIEILEGKKLIDYRLSVQTYVADETHNWNLRVCNLWIICDRLICELRLGDCTGGLFPAVFSNVLSNHFLQKMLSHNDLFDFFLPEHFRISVQIAISSAIVWSLSTVWGNAHVDFFLLCVTGSANLPLRDCKMFPQFILCPLNHIGVEKFSLMTWQRLQNLLCRTFGENVTSFIS